MPIEIPEIGAPGSKGWKGDHILIILPRSDPGMRGTEGSASGANVIVPISFSSSVPGKIGCGSFGCLRLIGVHVATIWLIGVPGGIGTRGSKPGTGVHEPTIWPKDGPRSSQDRGSAGFRGGKRVSI